MNGKKLAKPKWTAADRARHKAIREQFAHCPTQEDLQASGDFEGPLNSGAYFAIKTLVNELKQAREAAGLTLATVATLTGMGQAALSRLERGLEPNPTIDTLWRYARAVGRQIVLTQVPDIPTTRRPVNGNATKAKPQQRVGWCSRRGEFIASRAATFG